MSVEGSNVYQGLQVHNSVVQPLLTDLYQITMAYAYWKSQKTSDTAVFDLFFRHNPFQGEFTIFGGLEECLRFLENFRYSDSDIEYLKTTLPSTIEQSFFTYLKELTAKDVTLYAIDEGSVVFPRVPLIRVEGPLIVTQLLETTLLTLVNFSSLMATNAARYRMAAGDNVSLLEFGLRRAQGPDGGLSASKYAYIGGFDGTSNLLAGKMFNIPVKGTHAHAYITSFSNPSELKTKTLRNLNNGKEQDLIDLTLSWRAKASKLLNICESQASDGELAALVSFAIAFPEGFVALIDTYDVNKSGILNFCAVALALNDLGYKAIGVRIDSGDLAYLSNKSRETFVSIAKEFNLPWFANLTIIASNDINEETIWSLNDQKHSIDCFGIGTHLVTCQRQPALGCVYKLVEVNGLPRIKLSQDGGKITMPGKKDAFRLFGGDGYALIDLLVMSVEDPPAAKTKLLCRHPFDQKKRAFVVPSAVKPLQKVYWNNGQITQYLPDLKEIREHVQESLRTIRPDIKRNLNPTPYKVSVSNNLYEYMHELWMQNTPIGELS
ncbi:nicotinate phosphoribosyltransferase isoform X2 [Adelges cooleyi]|uniref:nicotinate phosphoribosyltransferase isoform X2 n=1 Tax=Adelges cooleyi TaxID=133065 RepID=UPI00217F77CC|nr:nicotinate phosphoribosyltransferase isoform X2 [Adelges cooleyi]